MARTGIQLCYPFEEKRLLKWQPPFICQPKYDGIRCRAVRHESSYILLSSEENVIFLPHITEALNKLDMHYEFDGELYVHGWSFEQINSVCSRTVNPHPDAHKIQLHIFDIVDEFKPQGLRITDLVATKLPLPMVISPYAVALNLDEIMQHYDHYLEQGYEGIIVRHFMATYVRKRSIYVMKFKPKQFDTYLITGWKEEVSIHGVAKGTLGSLEVFDGDNYFSVGSGLTAENRSELWKVRYDLIGRYAKVGYQHITSANKVPRFPVFIELTDKGE
jgi:ATP-dependent DNA ligase